MHGSISHRIQKIIWSLRFNYFWRKLLFEFWRLNFGKLITQSQSVFSKRSIIASSKSWVCESNCDPIWRKTQSQAKKLFSKSQFVRSKRSMTIIEQSTFAKLTLQNQNYVFSKIVEFEYFWKCESTCLSDLKRTHTVPTTYNWVIDPRRNPQTYN